MRTHLLLAGLAAGILASPSGAQTPGPTTMLMPGVTYSKEVEYTLHGPVVTHVITAPRPGGLYSLVPALANDSIEGRERLSSMERRLASTATIAAVNGDSFTAGHGPNGLVLQGGVLSSLPDEGRSSLKVDAAGNLVVAKLAFSADWAGTGPPRMIRALNEPPRPGWMTLYTPAWGERTPFARDIVEAVLDPFPAAAPGTDLAGRVAQLVPGGGHEIPGGGAVLTARGGSRTRLRTEAKVGTLITARFLLPALAGVQEGIGGGPVLVRNGRPVFRADESFDASWLSVRMARTAVGQRSDGSVLLVTADGSRPGYSVGMTNYELAQTMASLGAVTAIGLDTGQSATMAFEGKVLNRPSSGEQRIANALLLRYVGVQAPPPAEAVLSPNGDGVSDEQTLSYKLVRPSTVTATLTGPDDSVQTIASGAASPGTQAYDWDGLDSNGNLEPEGTWSWKVSAVDDFGRSSEASREFSLNTTLKGLTVTPAVLAVAHGGLQISLDLLHPATLTVQVESKTGTVLRSLRTGPAAAGHLALRWNGRVKRQRRLPLGRYVVRAVAENAIGRMDLTAGFQVR